MRRRQQIAAGLLAATRCLDRRRDPVSRVAAGALLAGFLSLNAAIWHVTPDATLTALGRFWRWQLHKRLVGRPVLLRPPTGGELLLPPWSRVASMLVANGFTEPREQGFLAATLAPGDGVIDVGANIGLYGVQAALVGARVVGFEPDPTAREWAERNVARNRLEGRVSLRPEALADYHGQAGFTTDLDVGNRLVTTEAGPQRPVAVTTLDRLEPDLLAAVGQIDVVKVDVEGHDLAVLHGAERILSRHHPTVIVEIWDGGRAIRAYLAGFGYRLFRFGAQPSTARLEAVPDSFDGEGNLIAIHPSKLQETIRRLSRPRPALTAPSVRWWPDSLP